MTAFACIAKTPSLAYCGRSVFQEFSFESPSWAVDHAASKRFPGVCSECVVAATPGVEQQKMAYRSGGVA